MKKIVPSVITATLVFLLAFMDVLGLAPTMPSAMAAEPQGIELNGTINKEEPGYLDPKATVLSSAGETRVNYRLVPSYSDGLASGTTVTIYMPSLAYEGGTYRVVGRDEAPTPLGVQGRVSADSTWSVLSDTTVKGGPIVMRYKGDLGPGVNPAFDLYLTTYNDGSEGVYGGVPEGTAFEINGFVTYEEFNREPGTSWETPEQLDDESRVKVISSDLTWEPSIKSYVVPEGAPDLVPIWDRYQYIDYMYTLKNTSTNPASNIDGHSVSFDIQSTASSHNGIIPFDINRWKHRADGKPEKNEDPEDTRGDFVGVPGEGGILIYDVTHWDGVSELTEEIPYTYSGAGMITINRETGENKEGLTPEAAPGDSEKKYLVSLPLSRQGFPSPPTKFQVRVITNVLFAKTAHWSKTRVAEREIVLPTYDLTFEHTTKQPDVVYGYETYNEVAKIHSASNAPIFDPSLQYSVDEEFTVDRVTMEFPESQANELKDLAIGYTYIDEDTQQEVTKKLTSPAKEHDPDTGMVLLTFDISKLNDLDWDRVLNFALVKRMNPGVTLPLSIKVYGTPYRVGAMDASATVKYVEKIASNDDFGQNTSYTEVPHETTRDSSFRVIYPAEVVPSVGVNIDGKGSRATVPYKSKTVIDFLFGVNDTTAFNSTTTIALNKSAEVIEEAQLSLKEALFVQAENVRVYYTTMDSADPVEIDLTEYSGSGDFSYTLPKRVANVIVETDQFTSKGKAHFVSVDARVGEGLTTLHEMNVSMRTYQPKPYDKNATAKATGIIDIRLPNALRPTVDVIGVYGDRRTDDTTHVGYESTFDVDYQLGTGDVSATSFNYVIDMLKPTKSGELSFKNIALQQALLDNVTDATITFVDSKGKTQAFSTATVSVSDVTLTDIAKIIVSGTDLRLAGLKSVAVVTYEAGIEIGSSQNVRATFTGTPAEPYVDDVTATDQNRITVRETKTTAKVEGVNQVTQGLGAGSKYSVEIYKRWSNPGYYYTDDYTLDQGYKTLGGFTSTLTRPTATYDNNDQRVQVNVALPYEHFDLYYVKIREEMRDYVQSVDLYRMVDGKEVLWKTVPGSQWVENSQEGAGYWRVNTARPGMSDADLFTTHDSVAGVAQHPYYKDAWDADVKPDAPVSRVEVNLKFTRESNNAGPQMPGTSNDVIEYMGRFYTSSITPLQEVGAKKATVLTTTDTFGRDVELTRTDKHSVNSLVSYPFAETKTGAHDNTSLANKTITMGNVGEYLASIQNIMTREWSYYGGHGPDVYSPAATEYDEWRGMYDPSSFHDKLIYEFVYPASPNDDDTFNYDAQYFTIEATSTLQYLTQLRVLGEDGTVVTRAFTSPLTQAPTFRYDNALPAGIHANLDANGTADGTFTISFGEGSTEYPASFEATFSKVAGFGDRTSEIDGAAEDTLGKNMSEVDVRVGGVVNGNKALKGTTNLYRFPDDAVKRTLMHSTSATLTGYTPKLGASMEMSFDNLKVYDYQEDGVTPNTSRVTVGIKNTAEADIKDTVVNVKPDPKFRTRLIEIPEDIFTGDWSVNKVEVTHKGKKHLVDLALFTLNTATGNYELDVVDLFDSGVLEAEPVQVTRGGSATLLKKHIENIAVTFVPANDTVRMWGSLQRAEDPTLPTRMREGGDVFVTGVWVDEDASGANWNSKPTFVSESTKGSNERIMDYSSFTASAQVTAYNGLWESAGSGNRGATPTLTLHSSAAYHDAPRLYTRVAQLETAATHLNQDLSRAQLPNLFYDADTGAQIDSRNIAVGDTVRVLYELRNLGKTATQPQGPGSLPVFTPRAHIEAPAYLEISDVQAASDTLLADANRAGIIAESPFDVREIVAGDVTLTSPNAKRTDVEFDVTLNDNESVFFYVEFTATSDGAADLDATQGKTLQWQVSARPEFAHHFMSYDSTGANGVGVKGSTHAVDYDKDGQLEQLGVVRNDLYRFADPKQLTIDSKFTTENVSGQQMTLTVQNIRNEILHNNTLLDLFITLDTKGASGFELTEFPTPTYPAGFTGEYATPQVFFRDSDNEWVNANNFDPAKHQLKKINELLVRYGTVPAVHEGKTFEPDSFTIQGKGHWQLDPVSPSKDHSYVIVSDAETRLTHKNEDGQEVAQYRYRATDSSKVYKAIPQVEFNIQSFDQAADARAPYNGATVGKSGYRPSDAVQYKLTAKNHTTYQGTSTNTPYGKAPLLEPVIIDKVPTSYLNVDLLSQKYLRGDGTLDVAQAVADGVLEMRLTKSADGSSRPFDLPKVTVETVEGADVAGAQTFNNARHNDGWGRLSNAEPADTAKNPAQTTQYAVVTYTFADEVLDRGEQLEIIYGATAKSEGLPWSTYANGKAVFAPFYGWYSDNAPVATTASNYAMDMAALLHDAGITGDRGHEMTKGEFLSNSYAWQPGAIDARRVPTDSSSANRQDTYYDQSANAQRSHVAYLNEIAPNEAVTNDLYESFKSASRDDNFAHATRARVNDGKVAADERILWAQDNLQLNRAWLYGASEMIPDTKRKASGVDQANFYEHDKSLNSYNHHRLGLSPYVEDDHTYAVELHEEFTVRLQAANLGDYPVSSGLEYTEILPLGVTPLDAEGKPLGISAHAGTAHADGEAALDSSYEILQTPDNDQGYRAPAQSQEAGTYGTATRDDMIPYVVRVKVERALPGLFNSPSTSRADETQHVDIRVRVFEELEPVTLTNGDELSFWYDQFTLTTIDKEPYVEVYDSAYGGFDRKVAWSENLLRYPNDGMPQGLEVADLEYDFGYYHSFYSVEPWGSYIRGLNAQGTATTASDGRPAIVTGDQIAMRKPTLRVWNSTTKDAYDVLDASGKPYHDSIQDFSVDLYEEFTVNATVENQQLEVLGEYNRGRSGYNRYSNEYYNDDIWVNAPQTIGGARGGWFEPTVSISLPYGVVPVLTDGAYARYSKDVEDLQTVAFNATINDITFNSSTEARNVTDAFDVRVERIESPAGMRYVLHFTVKTDRAADVAYGQSLVISPRVVTIDTPAYNVDTEDASYREIITLANSKRPVFNPVVSERYVTGATPSLTTRDQGNSGPYNNVASSNGKTITTNDRTRLDTTSTWSNNMGVLKITERLISPTKPYTADTEVALANDGLWHERAAELTPKNLPAKHDKSGAYGGTVLNLRKPAITNETKVATAVDAEPQDTPQVDAAGKYWYVTEVTNEPNNAHNPHEGIKTAGDVHNSRFVVTQYVTNFAEVTNEVRIKLGNEIYDRAEFEAMGYSVKRLTPQDEVVDEHRSRIQWQVTTPQNERGTYGELKSGEGFTLMYEVQLVDGFNDDELDGDPVWTDAQLVADSYVSLITDDTSLIAGGQEEADFIVQSPRSMTYRVHATDVGAATDIDSNGDLEGVYAHDSAEIEILKPKAEIRINTTRPRIAYSNGNSGDTYFNSSDTIEYVITHAKNTGSGLKEFVIEHVLPTDATNDDSVSVSNREITTNTRYVSTGAWAFPNSMLDRLAADGKDLNDVFKTYVYISPESAENGYERDGWALLNPGGTSVLTNEKLEIPEDARVNLKKIRVIVKSLDPDQYLVPSDLTLDLDADPVAPGRQTVLETDPENHSTSPFPETVTANAITVGTRVSSHAKSTLFIYGTAQAWGNYVGTSVAKLAQSETRSYLTPSRPVVNIKYGAQYYRNDDAIDKEKPFGWSDILAVAPNVSPHLKFTGEFINADKSMWTREEDVIFSEDALVDPFVTFQLPAVMASGDAFTYVPADEITSEHPLSEEHRSKYSLQAKDNHLWTWKLLRADGTEANPDSKVKHTDIYAGPREGVNRNVVSVWFEGTVYPGDKIVVEFIGSVGAYAPGADPEDLKSRALMTNNTGLLYPLNSQQNSSNKLGYATDHSDLNDNGLPNDRLVFAERPMFQYEVFDNFSKRKVSRSDLNQAGTVAPQLTPVREGGRFTFDLSVDNAKEVGDKPYPYPIMYDVLPFKGDTSISSADRPRGSHYQAQLDPASISLVRDGADPKTYSASEYTTFVGPLTKRGGKIVSAEMVSHEAAKQEAFYDSLGVPGTASAVRDAHFVRLSEVADDPALMEQVKTILVMFNKPDEVLPGRSKVTLSYDMKAPLNAPAHLEQFSSETPKDHALWNSFMATQRVGKFIPQESNNAGVYVTEQKGKAYIGNYVWNDVNYNAVQDEGTLEEDENGRMLLQPSKDLDYDGEIDDPGINGVKVTLLSPKGFNVDYLGNQIAQVKGDWVVVDNAGQPVLDEVFQKPIASDGPLVTVTETDFHGNAGYYTFSNIAPGDYRVMFEFPRAYDRFSATTLEVFKDTGVSVFAPGKSTGLPVASNDAALVTVTETARVDSQTTDEERMSFDMGVAHTVKVGGTIFKEQLKTLDGIRGSGEPGLQGYHVYLKDSTGNVVTDPSGSPMRAVTNAQGTYTFTLLPTGSGYYVEVTDTDDAFNHETVVSPIVHSVNPLERADDNDGFTEKGTTVVKTNPLVIDLQQLVTSKFADRMSVSVGFYDRSTVGVIGNRVWNDLNRDGLQDENEPGIAGQKLRLEQYTREGGDWTPTAYTQSTTSNADGYYYFRDVPSSLYDGGKRIDTKYQVVVDNLVTGYTFAKTRAEGGASGTVHERDSDFEKNGTMHTGAVGDHLVSIIETEGGVDYGITENTVDLGLVKHALSSLSGEVFIDTDRDGVQNDRDTAASMYTATLEVRYAGEWVPARQTADGIMIEPEFATTADAVIELRDINAYAFENLHIINNKELTPYEYRVKVTQVPLWQEVTQKLQGTDLGLDSDFTQEARDAYNTTVSDPRILGELRDADQLLPIETFEGVPAEDVDLGLIPLATQATLGDYIWDDQNRDGIQDAGEPGVKGVRVVLNKLIAGELVPVEEAVTDADGGYLFTVDVADTDPASPSFNKPIEYVVELTLSSRQTLTPHNAGGDVTRDSNFVSLGEGASKGYDYSIVDPKHTAVADAVTLVTVDKNGFARFDTSADRADVDGGVVVHDSVRVLGDTLFDDLDRDGTQASGEPGIGGLTVNLFRLNKDTGLWEVHADTAGNSTVTTDADGRYEFAVEVADLDKQSPHYRQAEEYRVLVEAPAQMRLVEVDNVFFYSGSLTDSAGTPNYGGINIAKPFSHVLTEAITLIDVDAVTGLVDLDTARDVRTADAGFAVYDTSVTIGGTIWQDADLDGLQSDQEFGEPGRTVTLWERVEGVWAPAEDLRGNRTQTTDARGRYAFEVSPTHYDEGAANFLHPREYRVTSDRNGFEAWSPLNVGDDHTIDSDAIDLSTAEPELGELEFGGTHTSVSHVFSIADMAGELVDFTTVRDDVEMDLGLKTYEHLAEIGGVVWDDANEDGEQQRGEATLADQQVTLWERIDGEWTVVQDALGHETQQTDDQGRYAFTVLPTDFDAESDGYLQPREYRTTMETPRGYTLSAGSVTAAESGELIVSLSAQIVSLDEAGNVDVRDIHGDDTLSYPFVRLPEAGGLAITGSDLKVGFAGLAVLLGLAVVFIGIRRQRAKREQ